ncbi:MAG: hypothetical protein ACKERG_01020 [Candidatus Hodgkinia cicadicola]
MRTGAFSSVFYTSSGRTVINFKNMHVTETSGIPSRLETGVS